MTTYRVELWVEGSEDQDPDRMPDWNGLVRARNEERAVEAAKLKAVKAAYGADRLARFMGIRVTDSNVYAEGSGR